MIPFFDQIHGYSDRLGPVSVIIYIIPIIMPM